MPAKLDARTQFKKMLLAQSLNITKTHAFASSQGMPSSTDQCIVAGDYNMTPAGVDAALRALDEGQWEILDLTGNRDFLFATDSVDNWLANT